jgi:hypothetical protein
MAKTTINDKIAKLHSKAYDLAIQEVERLARKILSENPELDEFVMEGSYYFTYKDPEKNEIPPYDEPMFEHIHSFMDKWDADLNLTGRHMMRFTATGETIILN